MEVFYTTQEGGKWESLQTELVKLEILQQLKINRHKNSKGKHFTYFNNSPEEPSMYFVYAVMFDDDTTWDVSHGNFRKTKTGSIHWNGGFNELKKALEGGS